jgi:hypothetical protein
VEPFTFELFIFGLLAVFLSAGAVAWWLDPRRQARRALAHSDPKRLGAVGEGERVSVRGVARRGAERRFSPITGRECIGYRVIVEARVEEDWRTVLEKTDCASFELHAEGVSAQVDGPFVFGLEMDGRGSEEDLAPSFFAALERFGVSRHDDWGRPRSFRLAEGLLEEGDAIAVLGRATLTVDPRGQRDSPRGQPILRVISGTKNEPTVLADEWAGALVEPAG